MRIVFILLAIFFAGCLEDKLGNGIVLPQGEVVILDVSDIRNLGPDLFDINLLQNDNSKTNLNLEFLANIPVSEKDNKIRYVLAKDNKITGVTIVSVTLQSRQNNWHAIVLPGQVTKPNLYSTLLYLLLANYSNKDISSYTSEEINQLSQLIEDRTQEKAKLFQIPNNYNPDFLFRFYRNALSSDPIFLQAIRAYGINYNFLPSGQITSENHPFGNANRVPILDSRSTTPLDRDVLAKESRETLVKATTQDLDGDPIFYLWRFEGEPVVFLDKGNQFRWTPDYEASRSAGYSLELWFSDGGLEQQANWTIVVENQNRQPTFRWDNCPTRATKDVEVTCWLSYSDPDGEAVVVTINSITGSNPVLANGQLAPIVISGQDRIELRWTPTNGDALNRAAAFSAELVDTSFGRTVTSHPMSVNAISQAPQVVTGIRPLVDGQDAIEWNQCAGESSDGIAAQPYQFSIVVRDPDNQGPIPAVPPDDVTVALSGTLAGQIRSIAPTKVVLANGDYQFFYQWTPSNSLSRGTIRFTMRDNHGMQGFLTENLEAANFNSRPCLNMANWTPYINRGSSSGVFNISASDQDGSSDLPFIEFYDFNRLPGSNSGLHFFHGLKHIFDNTNRTPLILRRKFFETEMTYRRRTSSLGIRINSRADLGPSAAFSGYVKISRPEANKLQVLTIPSGTIIRFIDPTNSDGNFSNAPLTLDFRLSHPTTFERGDVEVWAPVALNSELPPAGSLTELGPIVPDTLPGSPMAAITGVTVTNPSAFIAQSGSTPRGMLVFNNTNNTAVKLYRYQVIRSPHNPNQPGYEVVLPMDIEIPAMGSVNVPVWYRTREIAPNTNGNWLVTGYENYTVSSLEGLQNSTAPELRRTSNYGWTPNYIKVRAFDGHAVSANQINQFIDPTTGTPSGGGGTLTITHSAGLGGAIIFGEVIITRSVSTGSWVLPSGTRMRTANNTQFATVEDITFPAGIASQSVWVRRINHQAIRPAINAANPRSDHALITYVLSSFANTPINLASSSHFEALELNPNIAAQGFLIDLSEVNQIPSPHYKIDNYWYPNDPFQNFVLASNPVIKPVNQGGPAAGLSAFRLCRELGTDFVSTCTPCSLIDANRYYFRSNRCYLRYNLNELDLSKTLDVNLTFQERQNNGNAFTGFGGDYLNMQPSGNTNFANRNFAFTLKVKEHNDPPQLVDSNYQLIAAGVGTSESNPLDLGEFVESLSGEKFFNILDTDRGDDLKRVELRIDSQVLDIKTAQKVATPLGLRVEIVGTQVHQPDGRGLRTQARLVWQPTDQEAKRLSGVDGFIIKVTAQDNLFNVTESQFTDIYFKVKLRNKNQTPSLTLPSQFNGRIIADTYFEMDFMVEDADGSSPQGLNFNTRLTLCRDLNNNIINHLSLDSSSDLDPQVCHANLQYWSEELNSYNPNYQDNLGVSECRIGNQLNADLAVPKLSPVGVPQYLFGRIRQMYRLQWCPQKQHIGSHFATLFVLDNGDQDRDTILELERGSASPLGLDVVAPIFFESPLNDAFGAPLHFMPHTSAGLTDYPFIYKTRLRNTYKNPVNYYLDQAPSGMTISSSGEIRWSPRFREDISSAESLGHFIRIRAVDQITQDVAEASFYLKVQNPIDPIEEAPVIIQLNPNAEQKTVLLESETRRFEVQARDGNSNDTLFYRWYVNNELKADRFSYFDYKPSIEDGVLKTSDPNAIQLGEAEIKVEVTDGNYVVTRVWPVQIKNTIIKPELVFDIASARQERPPGQIIKSLSWVGDVKYQQNLGGVQSYGLIFSGFYDLGSGIRHFIWNLPFFNLQVLRINQLVKGPWLLSEDLPWLSGRQTQRIVWSDLNKSVIVTSQNNRAGGFGETTDALILGLTDWTRPDAISNVNKCLVECDSEIYSSNEYAGNRMSYSYARQKVFYVGNDGSSLYRNEPISSSLPQLISQFTADYMITGLIGNEKDSRLYVNLQNKANGSSRFVVYDTTSLNSIIQVANIEIWDGVGDHQFNRAMQPLVVDLGATRRIFGLLSGTGGVYTFVEQGGSPDISFIGVSELSASVTDQVLVGKKLAYLASQKLLIGSMKDSKQIFTIDVESLVMKVSATPEPIDSIQVFDHGLIVLINYAQGLIFVGR